MRILKSSFHLITTTQTFISYNGLWNLLPCSLFLLSKYCSQCFFNLHFCVPYTAECCCCCFSSWGCIIFMSVTMEVCLPLQVCALVLWSSIAVCSLSVTDLIFHWFQQGPCLSWRMYEGRDDNINQTQH